jgi:hypothetical protein
MAGRNIGYWATTGLIALAFAAGGLMDLSRSDQVVEGMGHLGYPSYFAAILGFWKLLGAVAVLAMGLPRLKEWAYAGMFFDLSGAAASHAVVGDPLPKVITPVILLIVLMASWSLRPSSRVVGDLGLSRREPQRLRSADATGE